MTEKSRPLLEAKVVEHEPIKPQSWTTSIAFINHLVRETNILLSVLGEQESGKSEFCQILQADLSSDIRSCVLALSPLWDDNSVLQRINAEIGVDTNTSFIDLIKHVNHQKTHTLLIIDDAQYLSVSFINSLLKALGPLEQESFFHVCLVSDFSLVPALTSFAEGDFPDKVHSMVLGVLNDAETKAYVQKNVILSPGFEFILTDELVTEFQQLTKGRIQAINQEMDDFFSQPISAKDSYAKRKPQFYMIAAAFVGAIGLGYVLSQNNQITPAETVTMALQTIAVPEQKLTPVFDSNIPPYDLAATRENLLGDVKRTPIENETLAVIDRKVITPKTVQHPAKQVAVTKTDRTIVSKKPIIKQVAKTQSIKPQNTSYRYTIQLLASRSKSHLDRFAQLHHIAKNTTIYQTHTSGTNWYVLTLGQYTEKNHAILAAQRLPNGMAQNKPWVRQLSDLKRIG